MGEFSEGSSLLQSLVTRTLLGKSDLVVTTNPEYKVAVSEIHDLYKQTWRWHGTGRYHYHNNDVKDVLEEIIKKHGLVPHRDPLDYTRGVMYSVSTSPSRIYSSLYAQLHFEKGKKLRNTFQTTAGWLYFTGSIAFQAALHDRRLFSKEFREKNNLSKEGTTYFHAKYTKSNVPGLEMGKGGVSDIPGNYPILIGIKEGAFQEADIAKVLRTHESRSETPILMTAFTHVEVPVQNIEEVKGLLVEAGKETIPIIPLEWGEEVSKSLPVSFLKDGLPLKT